MRWGIGSEGVTNIKQVVRNTFGLQLSGEHSDFNPISSLYSRYVDVMSLVVMWINRTLLRSTYNIEPYTEAYDLQ